MSALAWVTSWFVGSFAGGMIYHQWIKDWIDRQGNRRYVRRECKKLNKRIHHD